MAAFGKQTKGFPLPKPPPVNGIPQWGTGTRGAARYESDPIFRNSANQALTLGRNLFAGQGANFGGGANYDGLIGGSTDLSGMEAQMGAQSAADAASRDAALRRFIVSYGSLPDFSQLGISGDALGYLKGAMDPKTQELAANAEKEGLSIHARQAKDDADQRRRIPALLAGRGLLRSGQTGYDLGEQAQAYKTTQYDTLNELLGNIEGTVGSFQQAERDRQMNLAMARMQAASDAFGNWGDSYIGDTGPGTPAGSLAGRPTPPRSKVAIAAANRGRAQAPRLAVQFRKTGVYGPQGR